MGCDWAEVRPYRCGGGFEENRERVGVCGFGEEDVEVTGACLGWVLEGGGGCQGSWRGFSGSVMVLEGREVRCALQSEAYIVASRTWSDKIVHQSRWAVDTGLECRRLIDTRYNSIWGGRLLLGAGEADSQPYRSYISVYPFTLR